MAYKNSGAMKFNDATDLVIRADPNGTVESVYNKADDTEYINALSTLTTYTVTITNNTAAAATATFVIPLSGYTAVRGVSQAINPGATVPLTLVGNSGVLISGSTNQFVVVSGDVTIDPDVPRIAVVYSDCELTIETV